jgi:hypothetical protein
VRGLLLDVQVRKQLTYGPRHGRSSTAVSINSPRLIAKSRIMPDDIIFVRTQK